MIAREGNLGDDLMPSLHRLEPKNLVMARFPLLKLLAAAEVIAEALADPAFAPGTTLIDTSSGTWAWAAGQIARRRNVRLRIVTDPAVDPAFARILEDLGVQLDVVCPTLGASPQTARMAKLLSLLATGRYRYLDQYGNPAARRGYAPVAQLLLEQFARVDVLVGAVGSGASCSGVAAFYRTVFPELRLVGVDTFNSVLFGLNDGPRILRGLGNSMHPKNLVHDQFDQVHWVTPAVAFAATRRLYRETTDFRGPTTGAAWWVARSIALENPDATVVVMSADSGWRYVDGVYRDAWLHETGVYLDAARLPVQPVIVAHPGDAKPPWATFEWGRRSYAAVMNGFQGGLAR